MALYAHTHTDSDKNHRHQEIAGNFFANQIWDSHDVAKYNGNQNRECHSQKGDDANRYFHFIQTSIQYFDKAFIILLHFLPPGKDETPPARRYGTQNAGQRRRFMEKPLLRSVNHIDHFLRNILRNHSVQAIIKNGFFPQFTVGIDNGDAAFLDLFEQGVRIIEE